jgi:biotin-dependent carboxylase-like uncharacterized protein
VIEVVRAGALTTVQDLGRPGWAHLGVPRSGALDVPALVAANRLVGNPDGAAGLEITVTGCTVRCEEPAALALTGAPAKVTVDGPVVRIGPARGGVRTYLAVGGGIAIAPVLGSRATDTLSGLGPAPLRDGDRLPLGPCDRASSFVDATGPGPSTVELRVTPGPRADWFTAEAWETLCGTAYTLSPVSNRIGARLAGATLRRAVAGELPSEGVVLGAVQVPANGQPLVFLADHPTTGGYPVIAVVEAADLPLLAQARPGATVTFHGPER